MPPAARSVRRRAARAGIVSALCVVAGIWGFARYSSSQRIAGEEAEARRLLVEWGAVALKGSDGKHVETLTLTLSHEPTRIAEALEQIGRLRYLSHLDLASVAVTDEQLKHLKSLRRLKSLGLNHTAITDLGLDSITSLPVESLQVAHTQLTADALPKLGRMTTVKVLNLSGNDLGDDWSALSQLPDLEWLMFNDGRIGPGAVAAIGQMPKLTRLTIARCDTTDELLRQIKSAQPGINLEASIQPPK